MWVEGGMSDDQAPCHAGLGAPLPRTNPPKEEDDITILYVLTLKTNFIYAISEST